MTDNVSKINFTFEATDEKKNAQTNEFIRLHGLQTAKTEQP